MTHTLSAGERIGSSVLKPGDVLFYYCRAGEGEGTAIVLADGRIADTRHGIDVDEIPAESFLNRDALDDANYQYTIASSRRMEEHENWEYFDPGAVYVITSHGGATRHRFVTAGAQPQARHIIAVAQRAVSRAQRARDVAEEELAKALRELHDLQDGRAQELALSLSVDE